MKNFNFPLEKVVNLKEKNREQAEWAYSKNLQHLNEEKDKLNLLLENKNGLRRQMQSDQKKGTSIIEIDHSQKYIHYLDQLIQNQQNSIKILEESLALQLEELKTVKVDEKKWLNFREKKWQQYLIEFNQYEQKEMDDLVNKRFK